MADCASPTHDAVELRCRVIELLRGTYLPYQPAEEAFPSPVSWLEAVGDMKQPCEALDQSLLAFCAIQLRLADEVSISYDATLQLYNQALGAVIKALNYETATGSETLGAIVTVSTCEVHST